MCWILLIMLTFLHCDKVLTAQGEKWVVDVNATVRLPCRFSSFRDSGYPIEWYKGNSKYQTSFIGRFKNGMSNIEPAFSRRYSIQGDTSLRNNGVQENDDGYYKCVLQLQTGPAQGNIHKITVYDFNKGKRALKKTTVYTNSEVNLSCRFKRLYENGYTIEWRKGKTAKSLTTVIGTYKKEERQDTKSASLRISIPVGTINLRISKVTFKDTGYYRCRVILPSGPHEGNLHEIHAREKNLSTQRPTFRTTTAQPSTTSASTSTSASSTQPAQPQDLTSSLKALTKVHINTSNVESIAKTVATLTINTTALTSADVILSTEVLENIAKVERLNVEVGENFTKTVSQIMQAEKGEVLLAQESCNASSRIVKAMELFPHKIDLQNKTHYRIETPTLAVEVWDTSNDTLPVIGFGSILHTGRDLRNSTTTYRDIGEAWYNTTRAFLLLPKSEVETYLKQSNNGTAADQRIVFVVYANSKLFNSATTGQTTAPLSTNFKRKNKEQTCSSEPLVASSVISASIGGKKTENLSSPVQMSFLPNQDTNGSIPKCVYWEYSMNGGTGGWSTRGCKYIGQKSGRIICHCSHLTNFAILFDTFINCPPDIKHQLALSIVSLMGLLLSTAGLTITVITILIFKKLRETRSMKALFNLAMALLCVNSLFMTGIKHTENKAACLAVASLLHYFLLVAFMWMLVQAILQYLTFVKVWATRIPLFICRAGLVAWGLPAVLAVAVAVVDITLTNHPDRRKHYCWLEKEYLYCTFLVPVGLIIVVNAVIFLLVVRSIIRSGNQGLRTSEAKTRMALLQLKAVVLIFVSVGLTWVFGFFSLIPDASLVFQYLFCAFNSTQGLVICIMCFTGKQSMLSAWKQLIHRKQWNLPKHPSSLSLSRKSPKSPMTKQSELRTAFPFAKTKIYSEKLDGIQNSDNCGKQPLGKLDTSM